MSPKQVTGGYATGTLSPGAAAAGQTVIFNGCGFMPGESVELSFLGLLVSGIAGGQGCITLQFTIPGDTPPDSHPMELSGDMGSHIETEYQTL